MKAYSKDLTVNPETRYFSVVDVIVEWPVQSLTEVDFLDFQLNCELGDINNTVRRIPQTQFNLHCSSLVKVIVLKLYMKLSRCRWIPTHSLWFLKLKKIFKYFGRCRYHYRSDTSSWPIITKIYSWDITPGQISSGSFASGNISSWITRTHLKSATHLTRASSPVMMISSSLHSEYSL